MDGHFFPELLWGLAVLVSLTGWGQLLARKSALAENNPADWLESPAWGIAVSSFVGGLMNWSGLAGRIGLLLFLLTGFALAGFFLKLRFQNSARPADRRSPPREWKWLVLLVLPVSALALRFGGSALINTFYPYDVQAQHTYFNLQDDALSYLVSPERMLQTGSLGLDPFNSRQMMSALGAQHFLNAMALAVLSPEYVHIIEGGVGLAAACLAAAGLGMRLRLGRAGAVSLMLVPLIFRPWYINLTSTTTTVAVLIALCSAYVQLFKPDAEKRYWLLVAGLLLGAACSLKNTTIPTAGFLLVATAFLSALTQKSWRPLGFGLLAGLAGLVAMGPWLWWQYHSSGTPLYPLLGRGFHVEVFFPSAPAPFHGDAVRELKTGLVLPLTLLACLLLAWAVPVVRKAMDGTTAGVTLAMAGGLAVSWPIMAMATEYIGVSRYLVAACITTLTMILALAWQTGQQLSAKSGRRWPGWIGPLLLAVILLGNADELKKTYGEITPADLANSMAGQPYEWTGSSYHLRAAQSCVPAQAKILAYVDLPFLLNFSENPIFVADWPGEVSPPPGLPVHQGGEAVAAYLLGQNIRYVIYSYATQAHFPRAAYAGYLDPALGRVQNRQAALSFAFQDDLMELAQSRARLFDDGFNFVLDLGRRLPPKPVHP